MKVILLKNVKSLGKQGDIVNTSDGYARNYLFPRKLAEQATDTNVHILNNKKESERRQKLAEIEAAQKLAASLKGKELKLQVKTGENGKLFGSITNKDIADQIEKSFNVKIDKKKVEIPNAIKQTGKYDVELKLYAEVSTRIKVIISGQ
ncbi:50S ribosomal protein L9 [Clostridium fermenticellae]|uniref:Large ribosomal subunit protein bL9 n=1 Tax=Clostridium fermenticellae TaxID=2068654 RepID=A0A386H6L1_9CLOT|nr:50S ribosomal protein L9 [Clostridium fermenticellae]AYD41359.1 50S ribosomal protein L9 [Clostridium fermenticellae]